MARTIVMWKGIKYDIITRSSAKGFINVILRNEEEYLGCDIVIPLRSVEKSHYEKKFRETIGCHGNFSVTKPHRKRELAGVLAYETNHQSVERRDRDGTNYKQLRLERERAEQVHSDVVVHHEGSNLFIVKIEYTNKNWDMENVNH
ncbi:hypothetical protein V1477_012348 [Vespula maculifrons]|uniref:Uncharacterized protein n=1 Tax=Vespula maculifrons TaxID=7453 RepID=A0ABD2BX84_VESMC